MPQIREEEEVVKLDIARGVRSRKEARAMNRRGRSLLFALFFKVAQSD